MAFSAGIPSSPTGSEIVEVPRPFIETEKFVDIFEGVGLDSEIGIELLQVRGEGEGWQQVQVRPTIYRVFAVEPFRHLLTKMKARAKDCISRGESLQ